MKVTAYFPPPTETIWRIHPACVIFAAMNAAEPTPAEKTLKRVLIISLLDGWSVMIIAALGILITLIMGDYSGVLVGLLIGAAGWMELRGRKLLIRRDPAGMKSLARSQMFLLAVILVYCVTRLGSFDETTVMGNLTPDMEALLKESGIQKADVLPLVRLTFYSAYGAVALGTVLYQGGMTLYYRAKTKLVIEALTTPPRPRVSVLPPSV